ncbi:MAG: hypothetical protein AB7S92_13210 [Parvibaculaceae bacterium]
MPTDPDAKDQAAAKVLQEGVSGADHGAEQAIDRLPDRIRESRSPNASHAEQEPEPAADRAPYDATVDPRTGRPPLPLEAGGLSRERELQQLRNAQASEGEDEIEMEDMDAIDDEAEIDVTLEEDESPSRSAVNGGKPARMVSPEDDGDEDDYGQD